LSSLSLSSLDEFVVDRLQAAAQVQHGITLARKQRVDADSGSGSDLFETCPFDLVGDEDRPLLLGQLAERLLELLDENSPGVSLGGAGVRRRQHGLEQELFALLGHADRIARGRLVLPLAEEVGDPVASNREHPSAPLLNGLHQPVGFDDLVEDVLEQILHVRLVRHPLAVESHEVVQ
jgi:hypothetical protein